MDHEPSAGRCLIICARPIVPRMAEYHRPGDFVIAVDGGCLQLSALGITANLLVGDFDSSPVPLPGFSTETIRLPREKDDTDLVFAAREALRRGYRNICILGALGGRFDQSLASLHTLLFLTQNGAEAMLAAEDAEVFCFAPGVHIVPAKANTYLSIFPAGSAAAGVTLGGVKYPLENAVLTPGNPIGISNEFAAAAAEIIHLSGFLFVMLIERDAPFST